MSTHTIRLHRVLRSTPEKVYRAFLDAEASSKWLPPNGFTCKVYHMDVKVGGTFRMSFTNFTNGKSHSFGGEYLELVPHERIRYTDKFDDPNLPGIINVTVDLKKVSCGTEVNIVQEGVPAVIPAEACYLGWQESLVQLAMLVEPESRIERLALPPVATPAKARRHVLSPAKSAPRRKPTMSRLRCSITMSLDGYVAGPNQSADNPIGEGGLRLHEWVVPTRTFRAMHGDAGGGETGINDDITHEAFENVGATIMGRNMFGPVRGPWGKDPWPGWWGETPPFHHPVFVLTHHAREPLALQGGTTFHFVTDGIESALAQARRAAGGRNVMLGGGARVVQQYLAAGLLDELELHVVPLLLGSGERLLDHLDANQVKLEPVRTISGPGVAHLKYRRSR